jgi:hypothetical protein
MSTLTHGLQPSFTLPEIQAWIDTMKQKRSDVSLLAAEPLYNSRREWAILEMSTLLAEAIEEVRVISAALQEDSITLRSHATALRQHSDVLLERGRSTSERLPQCVPSPQEIHEAERRVLDMFREDARHAAQS